MSKKYDSPASPELYTRSALEEKQELSNEAKGVDFKEDAFAPLKDEEINGSASLFSGGLNLLKTILGGGIILLPLAINAYGYLLGTILMIISALASCFGLVLYSICASQVGRKSSPFAIASLAYPPAANILDIAIVLKCLGVALSYVLSIGKMMAGFMKGVLDPSTSKDSNMTDYRIWILIFTVVIIPLSFLKKTDHLKYTSFLGLVSIFYLVIVSIVAFAQNGAAPSEYVHAVADLQLRDISFFGIFIFAFTCHQNIFQIHNELRKNSVFNLIALSTTCISIAFVVYVVFGLLSYITYAQVFFIFKEKKLDLDNIFSVYGTDKYHFQIARVLFSLLLAFSVPLQVFPFRISCNRLLESLLSRSKKVALSKNWLHYGSTTFILIFIFTISMIKMDIATVFSLVGAVTSSIICYLLPALLYYKLTANQVPKWTPIRIGAVILGVFGVLVFLTCTSASIAMFFKKK